MTDTDTEELRAALADPLDVLAVYGRDDGHRDWLTAGCWVRHGEVIAHCSADLPERIARLLDALDEARKDAQRWRGLYRKAVNEANGLTNYVEDRPELRRAERNLTAIEAEARAIAMKAAP